MLTSEVVNVEEAMTVVKLVRSFLERHLTNGRPVPSCCCLLAQQVNFLNMKRLY